MQSTYEGSTRWHYSTRMPDAKEILRTFSDSNGDLITVEVHERGLTVITDARGDTVTLFYLENILNLAQALAEVHAEATAVKPVVCPECGETTTMDRRIVNMRLICSSGSCQLSGPFRHTEAKAFAAFARIRVEKE